MTECKHQWVQLMSANLRPIWRRDRYTWSGTFSFIHHYQPLFYCKFCRKESVGTIKES